MAEDSGSPFYCVNPCDKHAAGKATCVKELVRCRLRMLHVEVIENSVMFESKAGVHRFKA